MATLVLLVTLPSASFLLALVLTIAIETSLAVAWAIAIRSRERTGGNSGAWRFDSIRTLGLYIAGMNLVTHPIAWAVWTAGWADYWLVEALVVVAETFAIWLMLQTAAESETTLSNPMLRNLKKAVFLSILLNSVTAAIGWLI